jgi:hypothetical protein
MAAVSIQSSADALFAGSPMYGRRKRVEKVRRVDPDCLASRWRRVFCFDQREAEGLPLVQIGYGMAAGRVNDCGRAEYDTEDGGGAKTGGCP